MPSFFKRSVIVGLLIFFLPANVHAASSTEPREDQSCQYEQSEQSVPQKQGKTSQTNTAMEG